LKGIGRYTAGAISSIAFNQDKPIVDGNVLRVLARLYAMKEPIDDLKHREKFWTLQEKLIPKGRARDFNQGLMELGALVCTAQNPKCAVCPLRKDCAAYATGDPEAFPLKIGKKKTVRVDAAAVILEKDGRFLIHRRPEGAIMGGLWEFPEWKLAREKPLEMKAILKKTKKLAEKEFSASLSLKLLGTLKRNYTHHLESMRVFTAATPAGRGKIRSRANWPVAWVTRKEFEKYPFSSAHSKIAERFVPRSF
jgi:A/G-specific adenine glycosylase